MKWEFKNSLTEPGVINDFSKKFNIGYVFSSILLNREIDTEEKLRGYISKSLEFVHDPSLLPDVLPACERIIKAISEKEKIVIYGDYDVDGTTSVALLYSFLLQNGANADYYIPDRMTEGYGLNIKAINKISKSGARLLITVDCGITSVGEVELAKAQKMDVIITDHHNCKEKIPAATAVINPKRPDSEYPFSQLAGVGVIFKTVLFLAKRLGQNTKEVFLKYAPLAAVGTVADVVDLRDENRIIVDRGLKCLEDSGFCGIDALLELSNGRSIDSSLISFFLAPRINAAGRMESAKEACELLLCKDTALAKKLAERLDEINRVRQETERKIYEDALSMISSDPDAANQRIIVLAKEGWHHGVIGIVASKITEQFYKPCILLSCRDGIATGSGRSVEGINLFEALSRTESRLTRFGGHALAAGLTLNMSDFEAFKKDINEYIEKACPDIPEKKLSIDCSVQPSFLTLQNANGLKIFEPFGAANEKPVFALFGVSVVSASAIGAEQTHLRLVLDAKGTKINAVGFSLGRLAQNLTPGLAVDVAFNLEVNSYQGNESVQLILKDIKKSERK